MCTKTIVIIMVLVISLEGLRFGRRITDKVTGHHCHYRCRFNFNCACGDEDWMLSDPYCIPYKWVCDAESDCPNGADEIDCICPPETYQCGARLGGKLTVLSNLYNCVDISLLGDGTRDCWNDNDERLYLECEDPLAKCDGFFDCPDGRDEERCNDCPPHRPNHCDCYRSFWLYYCVGEGQTCFDDVERCDGTEDCSDGSDEEGCTCGKNQFICKCYETYPKLCTSTGCIGKRKLCDNYIDCEDGSDEEGCTCGDHYFTCDCYKAYQKTCSGSGCIAMFKRCDAKIDCSDASDEAGCACEDNQFTCDCYKANPKSCSGKGCVSIIKRCDGSLDCEDGSDEEGCLCKNSEFACNCYKTDPKTCSEKGCFAMNSGCDGIFDCDDGSDEEGCTCKDYEFTCDCYKTDHKTCSEKGCFAMESCCDGIFDCEDGSDEEGCTCEDSEFTCNCYKTDPKSCSDKGCIAMYRRCNGVFDCDDNSDEDCACKDYEFTCDCSETNLMSCSGRKCVLLSRQCDGVSDCSDTSDEHDCVTCPYQQFTCDCYKTNPKTCSGKGCVSQYERCNGVSDCSDSSDEHDCVTCPYNQFTCDCYKTNPKTCSGKGCVSQNERCNGVSTCSDGSDETGCTCKNHQFTCDCYKTNPKSCSGKGCVSNSKRCDSNIDCSDESDEKGCPCKNDQFVCDSLKTDKLFTGECLSMRKRCDGYFDCSNGYDEKNCTCKGDKQFTCGCGIMCSGKKCIPIKEQCDGKLDCNDGSDEKGCTTCRNGLFTCDCYKANPKKCTSGGCIRNSLTCNRVFDCVDGSDEQGCTACTTDQFACYCNRISCAGATCIPIALYLDGKKDCNDGSDEPMAYFTKTKCGDCVVSIRRLTVVEQCNIYTDCDNSTCLTVPSLNCAGNVKCNTTQEICMSRCHTDILSSSCNTMFQCENGQLEIADNFCDGKVDCTDGSDEKENQPGLKCSASFGKCVLPQRNLRDEVSQCNDSSDICSENACFQCFDRLINISQTQLCDGIRDCFDYSDECLCQVNLRKPICDEFIFNDSSQFLCEKVNRQCQELPSSSVEISQCQTQLTFNQSNSTTTSRSLPSHIRCQNKFGEIKATTCDGRSECKDFSDECYCEDPPIFCNDNCHNFYPIGDRYCDGIIDEAWKFINDSSCTEGFDEKSCPRRFTCKAGYLVSIDRVKVCDGYIDCDNGSDEVDCKKDSRQIIFSSETEMIASKALRSIFWVMSFLVIIGNSVVILSSARILCKEKMNTSQNFNHILMMNLSVSDFLMGIYLFIISVKNVQYSGVYGDFDYQWRSSLECSIVGSLSIISSETSCFIMTILTAFRLYNVFNPFTARTASTLKWKLGIALAWLISLLLALVPVLTATSNYFVHEVWFSNKFTSSKGWNKTDVMTFACRLASLSNQSIENTGDAWKSMRKYMSNAFPEYSPLGEIGYYGETSVCMARIYTSRGDQAWMYSLVIITFNFISFMFVAISYVLIYYKASDRPIQTSGNDKQAVQMQRRIARLIATDFACWIPICIMVYLKTGGVEISNLLYIITAGVLLPINSALNPLLYSPTVETYFVKLFQKKRK